MAIRLSGLVSGMDTESMVSELMKAESLKKTKIQNKITTSEWKLEKWKDLNTKLYSFYTNQLSKFRMQGNFNVRKVSSSSENKLTVTANNAAPEGTHTLKILQLASSQFVTGKTLASGITADTKLSDLGMAVGDENVITITAGSKTKTLTIKENTKISDFTQMLKSAGLNATYDTTQKRFFISSKESGTANAFTISATDGVDLSKLGLSTITKTDNGDGTFTMTGDPSIVTLVQPADAKVIYNGAEITSSTNVITANGLTMTLKGISDGLGTSDTQDDEVFRISVQEDTQAVYDMIKDFVKTYNELLKEMNEAYNASSAAGYEPLTDEQKAVMTDDQIEKWESKIKDSLLRRDGNLGTLIDTLRSIASDSVKYNGKDYSLATFGIASVNYTEKGILHIRGDKDDSMSSSYEDKLMKAINEDPDMVMEVFNQLADNLYSSFSEQMKSSTLRSALTLYNDKEINNQIKEYKDDLKEMEKKLQETETRYYKQFSAMESALSKLNSQSSSLMSMLGLNTNK